MAGNDQDREARLAEALRENLRRRKEQKRGAAEGGDDAETLFDEGMRLLSVPDEGMRGVQMIDTAAAQGHPAALERRAAFECMGIGRSVNWPAALDLLAAAAAAGSDLARRQLTLFAEDRAGAGDDQRDWQALAASVSLQDKFRPRPGTTLSASPLIRTVGGIASPAECAWLIDAAQRRLQPAYVNDPATGARAIDPSRTNRGATFPPTDSDCVIEMIRTRLALAIGIPVQCFEIPQVLHYSPGQEFKPHHDFLDPGAAGFGAEIARNGQRVATALIYLNDGYEAGETAFPQLNLAHRGAAGDALIFSNVDPAGRPDPATLHAGLPPSAGEKWIFSQWIREHPPGAGQA